MKTAEKLFVMDMETSGLNKAADRIIEFSGIKYENNNSVLTECDRIDLFICPFFFISEKIEELTGITNEKLEAEGVDEDEAFEIIDKFLSDVDCIVGYNNTTFDNVFLENMYKRNGAELPVQQSLDVLTMARDLIDKKSVENFKLGTIAKYYGLDEGIHFHSSIDDAAVTAEIFKIFLNEYGHQVTVNKNKPKAIISSVSYWEGRNHKMRRVYVNTNFGSVYFDQYSKCWEEKDAGIMEKIDMEALQEKVLNATGSDTIDELARFKGNIRVA